MAWVPWKEQLPQIKAENEAWRAKYLPKLKALDEERARIRDEGKEAMAALKPEVRRSIELAYGRPL
jgi:hypothetical protein